MKIGIMTLFHNRNYGAVLQAYALQHVLQYHGYDAEDIWYYREIQGHPINEKGFTSIANRGWMRLRRINVQIKKLTHILSIYQVKRRMKVRDEAFSRFIQENIYVSREQYSGHQDIYKAAAKYDAFICGSDNIWNKNLLDTAFFLDFVPDNKLKIAYAPGMSTDNLSEEEKKIILPLVNRIDYLSVRETSGRNLIASLTGRNVFQALDPTLLITGEEWRSIEKEVPIIPQKYLFCFFVGESKVARVNALHIGQKLGLPIITLPHMAGTYVKEDRKFGNFPLYDVDPAQFLWLIDHAEYVCTDSFHGTVFSILFGKEFNCFRRFFDEKTKSLNYRIDSLLGLLQIKDRIIEDKFINDNIPHSVSIDYKRVHRTLEIHRKASLEYLLGAINERGK